MVCVRLSNKGLGEKPYVVKGNIKHTGTKGVLRVYEKIEISERGKIGMWSRLQTKKHY